MNDEAASRLLAVLMLHERRADSNGVYCSECAQQHPCRTVRFATMDADEIRNTNRKENAPNRS